MSEQPIILTVQQLTSLIKEQIEGPFERVWVQGEVANLKKAASGHIYFSLIDPNTLLNTVLFRAEASHLHILPKNGDSIIAEGQIVLFAARGSYQLIVRSLRFNGQGSQEQAKQLLKKKLSDLGWFKQERKKQLPSSVSTIGVITSPTGAVIRDIVHVLRRRVGSFHLILNPVLVQGEEAPKQIAQAIYQMNKYAIGDLLIVCRGGGSNEDLAAFDSEEVAKAAFESTIPIISAVGHETDSTILDLVADVRAPTPSAAAEIACKATQELLERIALVKQSILRTFKAFVLSNKSHITILKRHLEASHPKKQIAEYRLELGQIEEGLFQSSHNMFIRKKQSLLLARNLCHSLAPKERLLQRKKELLNCSYMIHTQTHRYLIASQEALKKAKLSLLEKASWNIETKKNLLQADNTRTKLTTLLLAKLAYSKSHLKQLSHHLFALNPLLPLSKGYALIKNKEEKVYSSAKDLVKEEKVSLIFSDGSAQAIITEIKVHS